MGFPVRGKAILAFPVGTSVWTSSCLGPLQTEHERKAGTPTLQNGTGDGKPGTLRKLKTNMGVGFGVPGPVLDLAVPGFPFPALNQLKLRGSERAYRWLLG